jgi:phenylalanyl-tRNA synthetase beta chain
MHGRLSERQRLRRLVEDVLVGAGLSEAYTSSLTPGDPARDALRLPEPLSAEQAVLRTTLLPSLVAAVRHNVDAGNEEIGLFEIARVYLPPADPRPTERWRVAGIVAGGYEVAKGVVEALHAALKLELRVEAGEHSLLHPGKTARVAPGFVGELHPAQLEGTWGAFELDLDDLFADVPERLVYQDVITFPAVRQDLAFTVDEGVSAGQLIETAREAAGPELQELTVFDVYRGEQVGEGKKSIAFRAAFQSPERTLSDEDAAAIRRRIVDALRERFSAELRG